MQVRGDDRVEALGFDRHPHGHGVDQHLVPCHIGELARDLGADLVPHHHGVALRVRLGDDGEELARARAGECESETEDALDAGAGHDRDVGRDLDRQAAMNAPADTRIFALRVLAHDHPVELGPRHLAQRARYPRQDAGGADVGVLVERLADREPQAPEADMVRHVGRADGAEIDRIVVFDLLAAVVRHHAAGRAIKVRAPVERVRRRTRARPRARRAPS